MSDEHNMEGRETLIPGESLIDIGMCPEVVNVLFNLVCKHLPELIADINLAGQFVDALLQQRPAECPEILLLKMNPDSKRQMVGIVKQKVEHIAAASRVNFTYAIGQLKSKKMASLIRETEILTERENKIMVIPGRKHCRPFETLHGTILLPYHFEIYLEAFEIRKKLLEGMAETPECHVEEVEIDLGDVPSDSVPPAPTPCETATVRPPSFEDNVPEEAIAPPSERITREIESAIMEKIWELASNGYTLAATVKIGDIEAARFYAEQQQKARLDNLPFKKMIVDGEHQLWIKYPENGKETSK